MFGSREPSDGDVGIALIVEGVVKGKRWPTTRNDGMRPEVKTGTESEGPHKEQGRLDALVVDPNEKQEPNVNCDRTNMTDECS